MNEVDLVSRLREDIPAPALDTAQARLRQQIAADSRGSGPGWPVPGSGRAPNRRTGRGRARLVVAAGTAAAALAAGALVLHGAPGQPAIGHGGTRPGHAGAQPKPAGTAAQLVAYATRTAAAAPPFRPGPHEWTYTEFRQAGSSAGGGGYLLGPPNERLTVRQWTRVDGLQTAVIEHGRLVISPVIPHSPVPLPVGWPSVSYRYLDSLPASPARLKSVIRANLGSASPAVIFTAVWALMRNVVLPPRLQAELYSVLVSLPGVRFDPSLTDLVGRSGIGLYLVTGNVRDEIVISPVSYGFMGEEFVAVRAYASTGLDGTAHIRKGQILGWAALLQSGIVRHAGQVPGH
jgi:hypothetical protein